ncbi:acyl-CoA carboxylase epsilon subunit [uncultured Pseudokineococcus sp.]|uniref:acyl-CoA carboxylase epsilon subunit n=1 Tax=uncultured Pseudokineococcus sp. TaxID=1642928 RepID=UPI0026271D9D|nr:acyl-CoA carboxylase epsilon subunit [uncultured Pseudokineococcus sp.]
MTTTEATTTEATTTWATTTGATTTGATTATGTEGAPPLLRVLRGRPDDAELAALVAVVAARQGSSLPEPAPEVVPAWGDPAHRLGVAALGPDAWRTRGWGHR